MPLKLVVTPKKHTHACLSPLVCINESRPALYSVFSGDFQVSFLGLGEARQDGGLAHRLSFNMYVTSEGSDL